MTVHPKPRYSAAMFNKLRTYPRRHCQLETCGKQLTPHVADGKLEPLFNFKVRKTCNDTCRAALMKLHQQERERQRQEALDELVKRMSVKQRAEPGPPTLTDPAYGGPPAPVEVAEEVAPVVALEQPKDPALNRPVRPVKLPSTTPPRLPPVPPPAYRRSCPTHVPRPRPTPSRRARSSTCRLRHLRGLRRAPERLREVPQLRAAGTVAQGPAGQIGGGVIRRCFIPIHLVAAFKVALKARVTA